MWLGKKRLNMLKFVGSVMYYKEYKEKLASRYPFNINASKDVSLKDFEVFFAPGGTLDTFL